MLSSNRSIVACWLKVWEAVVFLEPYTTTTPNYVFWPTIFHFDRQICWGGLLIAISKGSYDHCLGNCRENPGNVVGLITGSLLQKMYKKIVSVTSLAWFLEMKGQITGFFSLYPLCRDGWVQFSDRKKWRVLRSSGVFLKVAIERVSQWDLRGVVIFLQWW